MNNNNSLFNHICNMFNNLSSVTNSKVQQYILTYIHIKIL